MEKASIPEYPRNITADIHSMLHNLPDFSKIIDSGLFDANTQFVDVEIMLELMGYLDNREILQYLILIPLQGEEENAILFSLLPSDDRTQKIFTPSIFGSVEKLNVLLNKSFEKRESYYWDASHPFPSRLVEFWEIRPTL